MDLEYEVAGIADSGKTAVEMALDLKPSEDTVIEASQRVTTIHPLFDAVVFYEAFPI